MKGEVWLFKDKDFKGELVRFVQDTPSLGKFNDQTTSLRCGPDTTIVLFQDSEYKGKSKVFFGDVPHVGADFNDKVRSLRSLP